jgi:hypothetical protein
MMMYMQKLNYLYSACILALAILIPMAHRAHGPMNGNEKAATGLISLSRCLSPFLRAVAYMLPVGPITI